MKTRVVQTRFWKDEYITQLSSEEKLIFLFLLTNETIGMTGIYQVYPQEIALWCGTTEEKARKVLDKLTSDKKIIYKDGWIRVMNHSRYQNYNSGNRKNSFKKEMSLIPQYIKEIDVDQMSTSGRPNADMMSVKNQKSKIINQKLKINNKNSEKKKNKKKEKEIFEIRDHYNRVFQKKTTSVRGYESNFDFWKGVHDLDKIKKAIENARQDPFWKDKLTLTILFRQRNPRGEAVDLIEDLANSSQMQEGGEVKNPTRDALIALKDVKFLSETQDAFPDIYVKQEAQSFLDYIRSTGKSYEDYRARFRNWLRDSRKDYQSN